MSTPVIRAPSPEPPALRIIRASLIGACFAALAAAALTGTHALGWVITGLAIAGAVVERIAEGRGHGR